MQDLKAVHEASAGSLVELSGNHQQAMDCLCALRFLLRMNRGCICIRQWPRHGDGPCRGAAQGRDVVPPGGGRGGGDGSES